ncbi:coiled-coil domain-containing protein-domain-containing protein [Tuber indicum]|nr:coiled-coil domain-containing protein-domain-containing protein [Tuber indicum]
MPGRIVDEMEVDSPALASGPELVDQTINQAAREEDPHSNLDRLLETFLSFLRCACLSRSKGGENEAYLRPCPSQSLNYISKNSSTYFSSPDLELADPLLYDRLIRHYQTPSEREAEGRSKGWSGILEADITRSEAKVEALRENPQETLESRAETNQGQTVSSKEEAEQVWRETMTLRFLEGRDEEADYATIDGNEEYDDYKQIERDAQDAYFDAESPSVEGSTFGDTGIQDF